MGDEVVGPVLTWVDNYWLQAEVTSEFEEGSEGIQREGARAY
jgi:hypothetical protein